MIIITIITDITIIKCDSGYLEPIIVDLITKQENKIKIYTGGYRTSNLLPAKPAFQHTSNIFVCHYLIFICTFYPIFRSHGATQIFYNTF